MYNGKYSSLCNTLRSTDFVSAVLLMNQYLEKYGIVI